VIFPQTALTNLSSKWAVDIVLIFSDFEVQNPPGIWAPIWPRILILFIGTNPSYPQPHIVASPSGVYSILRRGRSLRLQKLVTHCSMKFLSSPSRNLQHKQVPCRTAQNNSVQPGLLSRYRDALWARWPRNWRSFTSNGSWDNRVCYRMGTGEPWVKWPGMVADQFIPV
jgi:hypothetical protein